MPIGRAERFKLLEPLVTELFGGDRETVFALLTLAEMAWHDCYGEVSPPAGVVEDILVCSGGEIEQLVKAAHMAVIDRRDLQLWADQRRGEAGASGHDAR